MKLLILGGTVFVGRHLAAAALAAGHQVTLFNRGQHNPDLFPAAEKLRGNRDGDLGALRGRRWDAVIDTCGYVPRLVKGAAELLAGAAGHYTFISTISVYADMQAPGTGEDAPTGSLPDPAVEEVNGQTYGPLKALCEQAAAAAMPGRVLVIRPGLIVGPDDPTDRFTYWPRRCSQGGEVLAPAPPEQPVQFIDVRDLAAWILRLVAAGSTGTYNATGPDYPLTLAGLLDACQAAGGARAAITWVDPGFLAAHRVAPFTDLPLWVPGAPGLLAVRVSKAVAAGLTFRPLAETVRETLAWDAARPPGTPRRAGLTPDREAALLQAWHARAGA